MSNVNKIKFIKSEAGFTMVELLIVIGVTIIIAAAASPIYSSLYISSQLNETSSLIIQTLRTAKQNSLARVNDSVHGVRFMANSYTLYQGDSYSARDLNFDRLQVVDDAIAITTNLVSGEVNFSKSLGQPDNAGTITLTHNNGRTTIIAIDNYKIEEQ